MNQHNGKKWKKVRSRLRAGWRDTFILLREFFWPLLAFALTIIGGGALYYILSLRAGESPTNLAESMYHILGLIFLQPMVSFPRVWYLEIFNFLMPLLGIGILAQGVADFGVMLFNRRNRGKEWEVAVASTMNRHIIIVGLGHLGFRVAQNLAQMDQDLVVIETKPQPNLENALRKYGIPLIKADAAHENTLLDAGVERAQSIVLCTQIDTLNLQVALKARSLNPGIKVILRIFDEEFAKALHQQFGFVAMSATEIAAPAFTSAATGVDITQPITIGGEALCLARLKLSDRSRLTGKHVEQLEQGYDLSVVLMQRDGDDDLHPSGERVLQTGDVLAVLGAPPQISRLMQDNPNN